jgi:predicted DsbA family dithiol-disulfide isomerase
MSRTSVTLFSDFTCPFSHVTEAALRHLQTAGSGAEIDYRAFELHPVPAPLPAPEGELPEALLALAAEAGVRIDPPAFVPRTRKAHEAARFARRHGAEGPLREAIFRAYWADAKDIGRIDVLVSLAGALGLPAEEMKIALDIDALADEVIREHAEAERLGVRHTPTLIIGSGEASQVIVGAHPLSELQPLLRWAEDGAAGAP